MVFHKHKILFSHKILVLLLLIYCIDVLSSNYFSKLVELNPLWIVEKGEFWRLFTFPLSYFSLANVVLLVLTVIYICPLVEKYLFKVVYPVLTILLIALQGVLQVLVFWKENILLGGIEGLLIFFNLLALFIFTGEDIAFIGRYVKVKWVVPLFLLCWSGIYFFLHLLNFRQDILMANLFSLGFGFVSAFLIFAQFKILTRAWKKKAGGMKRGKYVEYESEKDDFIPMMDQGAEWRLNRPKSEKEDFISMGEELAAEYFKILGVLQDKSSKCGGKGVQVGVSGGYSKNDFSEDRLNEILDKISTFGLQSLTDEEMEFLEEYSKSL